MIAIFVLYTLVSRRLTILMARNFLTSLCNLRFLKSNKNPSHLVLIGRDFHHLVLSGNLNGRGVDWMHIL
jgi:hypothetical protein